MKRVAPRDVKVGINLQHGVCVYVNVCTCVHVAIRKLYEFYPGRTFRCRSHAIIILHVLKSLSTLVLGLVV